MVKHEEGDSLTPQCLEPFMATFRNFLRGCDKDRMLTMQAANKEKAQNGSGGMEFWYKSMQLRELNNESKELNNTHF